MLPLKLIFIDTLSSNCQHEKFSQKPIFTTENSSIHIHYVVKASSPLSLFQLNRRFSNKYFTIGMSFFEPKDFSNHKKSVLYFFVKVPQKWISSIQCKFNNSFFNNLFNSPTIGRLIVHSIKRCSVYLLII